MYYSIKPTSSFKNVCEKQGLNVLRISLIGFLVSLFTISSLSASNNPLVKSHNITSGKVVWHATKVTGDHTGTVNFQSGELIFDNGGNLTGGILKINMTTIACTDLSGGSADNLNRHLKSDDFFGVSKFPAATLEINKVTKKGNGIYNVVANVTIKGITKQSVFEAKVGDSSATAKLSLDRSEFDVRYGSGSFFSNLGNDLIHDEFTLDVSLNF